MMMTTAEPCKAMVQILTISPNEASGFASLISFRLALEKNMNAESSTQRCERHGTEDDIGNNNITYLT